MNEYRIEFNLEYHASINNLDSFFVHYDHNTIHFHEKEENGRTSLHFAADLNIVMAEDLLAHGAKINSKDIKGMKALHCAVSHNQPLNFFYCKVQKSMKKINGKTQIFFMPNFFFHLR
ncbi:hypothetical protein TVAG_163960 [Trichomonas vaginalis G3]|uniref:Uncharacterized protein n=1 Tax=Trichomonas vaginalis (strain ATCC PRA-98 / G3) TaxID=412133 RepID=A2DG73_TRIV3|nr:Ankyrin repeat family [Trichomonas vaginalis G3]EAY20700.1 hypothetical protein TVAG_163960 [Trichomonas vaginalis G3]KAI5487420.1 Ankyrin repeat family [Trichomonas vaginalis G3]|eukprot:XP_001581686.1 hypothetical protein [Trichomonas vaginalis G3]